MAAANSYGNWKTVVAEEEKLITSCIENKDDILKTIKDFLGKGM
jgi:hypothetical protein